MRTRRAGTATEQVASREAGTTIARSGGAKGESRSCHLQRDAGSVIMWLVENYTTFSLDRVQQSFGITRRSPRASREWSTKEASACQMSSSTDQTKHIQLLHAARAFLTGGRL